MSFQGRLRWVAWYVCRALLCQVPQTLTAPKPEVREANAEFVRLKYEKMKENAFASGVVLLLCVKP